MHTSGARLLLRGQVVSFDANPAQCDPAERDPTERGSTECGPTERDWAVRHYRKGAVVVGADGRIAWRGHYARLPLKYRGLQEEDHGASLLLPGFIDPHIHFPQYRMLAAPGRDLLDWLERFTFTEESRYRSPAHAAHAAEVFLDRLLANGTTCPVAYGSVHRASADALFDAAERRGMALYAGKTMMDCNAPAAVLDTAASGAQDTRELVARWHRRGRLRYAITLRFAVTSTEPQLQSAGELCAEFPGCVFQTHLSESKSEIEAVRARFPWARDYTDVYDRFGLLRPRALFGHGIHLSARERRRLSATGSAVIHCPTSNTFLGSGLFNIDRARRGRHPIQVGIATDVGGGTSYSMLATLGEAYKVAMLSGSQFGPLDAFYMATRGNACCLGASDEIGSLEPGLWADLVVLDPCATPVLAARHELSESLEDVLFALMLLGDDRAIAATYVAGRRWLGPRPGRSPEPQS